jgi:hypothetical protein
MMWYTSSSNYWDIIYWDIIYSDIIYWDIIYWDIIYWDIISLCLSRVQTKTVSVNMTIDAMLLSFQWNF